MYGDIAFNPTLVQFKHQELQKMNTFRQQLSILPQSNSNKRGKRKFMIGINLSILPQSNSNGRVRLEAVVVVCFQSYLSPIQTGSWQRMTVYRRFLSILPQSNSNCIDTHHIMHYQHSFNPTLVQFKLGKPNDTRSSGLSFNPTLVQFKLKKERCFSIQQLIFQSYLSPIQTCNID